MNSARPSRPKIIRMVGIFPVNSDLTEEAKHYISRDDANELIDTGFARSVNRGRAIQLIDRKPLAARGLSCKMGPRLMQAVAEGARWAREILEMWKPNHCGVLA
jgi:hypothetical protein